jgi:hypothetical protein
VTEVVAWAASNGDRSENADYQYGKRRWRQIDGRIRFPHPAIIPSQSVTILTTVTLGGSMKQSRTMVLSMRLPVESGKRLKRIANRHGWTASDASARLVEEGLRRSEFAFLDFRDSPAGRQAYIQGSTLAIWEVMLLLRSYKGKVKDVAKHLKWPEARVRAALYYSEAFPEEVNDAIAENDSIDFDSLKRMLPQAVDFAARQTKRG